MQVKVTHPHSTQAVLTVIPNVDELRAIKEHVLGHFQSNAKVPGFRAGKIPAKVLEKSVDQKLLQSEFLEEAIQQLYTQAVRSQKLRPVNAPEVSIKKFVPFEALEFEAKVAVIGNIKLADYKKVKVAKHSIKITTDGIAKVITSLQSRLAEKTDVDRPAQVGDEVWIDFKGFDAKDKPVNGADSKNYPLQLGSNAFIPGFEDNIVGLKPGDEKTFTLTFPKDYGIKALANKKVTFKVNLIKVQAVKNPKVDDEFAAKVGPFKTVSELKADIKKQLTLEQQQQADRAHEAEIVQIISSKSSIDIPEQLVDEQVERMEQEERQNLTYRGQTWEEHLSEEGVTAEQHREQKRPEALNRLKASLILAEVAEAENLKVMPEELEIRIQVLKSQYKDDQMLAELEKPENHRDIANRLLTEKTLERLVGYATSK